MIIRITAIIFLTIMIKLISTIVVVIIMIFTMSAYLGVSVR